MGVIEGILKKPDPCKEHVNVTIEVPLDQYMATAMLYSKRVRIVEVKEDEVCSPEVTAALESGLAKELVGDILEKTLQLGSLLGVIEKGPEVEPPALVEPQLFIGVDLAEEKDQTVYLKPLGVGVPPLDMQTGGAGE